MVKGGERPRLGVKVGHKIGVKVGRGSRSWGLREGVMVGGLGVGVRGQSGLVVGVEMKRKYS